LATLIDAVFNTSEATYVEAVRNALASKALTGMAVSSRRAFQQPRQMSALR